MEDEERSTEERVGRVVIGAGWALWALASLIFTFFFIGLVVPVTRDHCTVSDDSALAVESSWSIKWELFAFADGSNNEGQFCIRNTVPREALSAIGIWPLGSPEDQVAEAATDYVGDSQGEATSTYIEAAFGLLDNSDKSQAAVTDLQAASNPAEARDALVRLRDYSQVANDALTELDPPPDLETFHTEAIELNAKFISATDDLIDALDSGQQSQIQVAYSYWLDLLKSSEDEFQALQDEYEQALDL